MKDRRSVMKKILVGYTGRLYGDKMILEVAKEHAKAFDASLIIASSIGSITERNMVEVEEMKNHLAYVKDTMVNAGISCETRVFVRGVTPGEDLVDFARDENVDEIIIGIENKSKVGKLLFGSNAQYIILEAPCPVVCVK
jgi:nucleotide-binding universal stress UspA family protein